VTDASPEVGAILEPFLVLNAVLRQAAVGQYLDQWRGEMDPLLVKRLELARSLSAADVSRAEVARSAYHLRLRRFFESHDLLCCPTTATAALPLSGPIPAAIGGRPVTQPTDMLIPTLAFNLSGYPAISVPCGTTAGGLPVGLQLVAGWRGDARVLAAAAAFEAAFPWADRRPPLDAAGASGRG
jgi:amidase